MNSESRFTGLVCFIENVEHDSAFDRHQPQAEPFKKIRSPKHSITKFQIRTPPSATLRNTKGKSTKKCKVLFLHPLTITHESQTK